MLNILILAHHFLIPFFIVIIHCFNFPIELSVFIKVLFFIILVKLLLSFFKLHNELHSYLRKDLLNVINNISLHFYLALALFCLLKHFLKLFVFFFKLIVIGLDFLEKPLSGFELNLKLFFLCCQHTH